MTDEHKSHKPKLSTSFTAAGGASIFKRKHSGDIAAEEDSRKKPEEYVKIINNILLLEGNDRPYTSARART